MYDFKLVFDITRFVTKPLWALVIVGALSSSVAAAQTPAPAIKPVDPNAAIEINIDEGVLQPIPIAISFSSAPNAQGAGATLGAQIAKVVSDDLERSGYFAPINPAAFIQNDLDVNVEPRFADWQAIHALDLAMGKAYIDADGKLQVDFRLWDVFSNQRNLIGQNLTATPENWRRVAHKIADLIYEKLTGHKGYFDTRIVFVAESGARGKRIQRLAIMDQDGANPSYLTDGALKVMSPRFSADGSQIAYMALSADSARIYILDIETNRQEQVGSGSGYGFCSALFA